MKKKFVLLLAFVFALVLAMSPVTSYAEETPNYVAKINETSYETLKEAIKAGGEITVLKDCILDEKVKISNPVTIQADDPVTITSNMGDVLTVVNGGELTLGANITIESSAAILYANGGTINIDGAKLKCTHEKDALGFVNNGGTINMDSGSLESYWTSLTADGDTTLGATINIFGGTAEVSASNSNTIIVREQGKAVIGDDAILSAVNNATIWAHTGGVLEVNGGTISSENGAVSVETNASATIKNGEFTGSIYTSSNGTITIEDGEFEGSIYANGGTITVQDGEFTNSSTNDKIIYTNNNGKVSVYGGTFTKNPSAYVEIGYEATKEGETWTVEKAEIKVESGESSGSLGEGVKDNHVTEDTLKDALDQNKEENKSAFESITDSVDLQEVTNQVVQEAISKNNNFDKTENAAPVEVEVRPYLNVSVERIEGEADNKTMTLDIKAMYDVYAVQQKSETEKAEAKIDSASGKELSVTENQNTTTFKITVPLPEGFVSAITDRVVVEHQKDGGSIYTYETTLKENSGAFTATFENPNGFSTFVVKKASEPDVKYNVNAESSLGFSFFVEKNGITAETFTATITHNENSVNVTATEEPISGTTYYKFYYEGVVAKEMTDEFTLSIKNANGTEIFSNTASVKQYAMAAISDTTGVISETEKTLLRALLNYGAEAQNYFEYKTDHLANAELTETAQTSSINVTATTTNLKHNLALESMIELGFFVPKSDITGENPTATINNTSVLGKSVMIGDVAYWRFAYSDIAAKEISNTISFSVSGIEGTITDEYSVANYAQLCIDGNKKEAVLMTALNVYGAAAEAHFSSSNE